MCWLSSAPHSALSAFQTDSYITGCLDIASTERQSKAARTGIIHAIRVAAVSRPDGFDADGLPFPTGHKQMEQGGAPVVFLHLVQLARRAAARLRDSCAADRRDNDIQGVNSDLPPGSPQVPHGRKITDEEFAQVNLKRDKFHGEWNYTIHPSK
jgi:hypothetical protein